MHGHPITALRLQLVVVHHVVGTVRAQMHRVQLRGVETQLLVVMSHMGWAGPADTHVLI